MHLVLYNAIPLSKVDEVVWFSRDSILLPNLDECNPVQVHTCNMKWTHEQNSYAYYTNAYASQNGSVGIH